MAEHSTAEEKRWRRYFQHRNEESRLKSFLQSLKVTIRIITKKRAKKTSLNKNKVKTTSIGYTVYPEKLLTNFNTWMTYLNMLFYSQKN